MKVLALSQKLKHDLVEIPRSQSQFSLPMWEFNYSYEIQKR